MPLCTISYPEPQIRRVGAIGIQLRQCLRVSGSCPSFRPTPSKVRIVDTGLEDKALKFIFSVHEAGTAEPKNYRALFRVPLQGRVGQGWRSCYGTKE